MRRSVQAERDNRPRAKSASSSAQVEPLPLVATNDQHRAGRVQRKPRGHSATRSSDRSIVFGCRRSMYASHASSVVSGGMGKMRRHADHFVRNTIFDASAVQKQATRQRTPQLIASAGCRCSQRQQLRDFITATGGDRRSCRWRPFAEEIPRAGSPPVTSLAPFCSMTRGPANPISAFGSAITTSPMNAKLADTPPMVGRSEPK